MTYPMPNDEARPESLASQLPREACQVRISAEIPNRLPCGGTVEIPCVIENRGSAILVSAGPHPVYVAYRWFHSVEDEWVQLHEGSRTDLPDALSPQRSVACNPRIEVPEEDGHFMLRISLVQEHVAWFDDVDQSNACARLVKVAPPGPLEFLAHEIQRMSELQSSRHRSVPGGSDSPTLVALPAPTTALPRPITDISRQVAAERVAEELQAVLAKQQRYQRLVVELRAAVERVVTPGAAVAVVNRGDSNLLDFTDRRGWHFPQDPSGTYAGYYPADSDEAIDHLESLRARGAEYLVFPATSFWWLDFYDGLRSHLDEHAERVWADPACVIYRLRREHSDRVRSLRALPGSGQPDGHWDANDARIVRWG